MDPFLTALSELFGGRLRVSQRDGLLFLRDLVKDLPLRQQAYVLATVFHETAREMQPLYEGGARSYFDKYEAQTALGRRLGNRLQGDGYLFRGRGYVQITGRANYAKAAKALGLPLEAQPDLALRPDLAAQILLRGMSEGWFTGKKLSDYIGESADYRNARRIVNGTDRAGLIAGYASRFEAALSSKPESRGILSFILKLLGRG